MEGLGSELYKLETSMMWCRIFHGGKERDVAILKTKRWNCGACKQILGEGGESLWCLITWLVIKWVKIEGKRVIMVAVFIVVVMVILVVVVVVKVVIAIIGLVVVVVDQIGDVDPTDEDGDTEVSVSLGEISSEGKKSWESDIGDCDNTGDGGKTTGRAIITWGGEIALYACMASIYGSSCNGEKISMSKRYLVKSFEEVGELLLGIVGK
nr:hypothetical protein [Tanacetum cinerariifolium]